MHATDPSGKGGRAALAAEPTAAGLAELTLVHALGARAAADPRGAFATFGDRDPLETGETWDLVRRFSATLRDLGVGIGDRVLLALENSPEFLIAWFGIGHAGATMVPLVPRAGSRALARAVQATEPKLAIIDANVELKPRPGMRIVAIPDAFNVPLADSFAEAFAAADPDPRNDAAGMRNAAIMFTSGTTGAGKGVVLTHAWYRWASEDVAHGMGYGPGDMLYTALPLGHANAQDTTVGPALVAGARVTLDERFSASRFWERIAACGATSFNLIAAMPRILLSRSQEEFVPGHSARQAFAIPALPSIAERFAERFGVRLRQGYGSTEIGVPVFQDDESPADSCGRPLGGTRIRITAEDGTPQPPGAIGEIRVWSPRPGAISSHYWRHPEGTAEAWGGGWFRTGDIGSVGEAGELYFAGRLGDVIRRKGERLTASDLEEVIADHPGVAECAVVATADESGEDRITVYLVAVSSGGIDSEDLARHCVEQLGAAAAPDRVILRSHLPHTVSGKVAKGRLGEEPAPEGAAA